MVRSSTDLGALPSYKKPPVNEVYWGLRFHPPDEFYIPHIGSLWEKFRNEYPKIHHVSQIATSKGEILIDEATGVPIPRVWFISKSDDQLIQFQIDRFYFNWRRRENEYPRYSHVIKSFEKVLEIILDFFSEFKFGDLEPIEYELTYINHIPKGQGWDTIDDLPKIFSDLIWKQNKKCFLPNPEKVAWHTEYPFQEQKGHLIVDLKQAIRTEDKVPLFVLEMKTKGIAKSKSKESIREWFDLAHEWIVRGFTDLTTSEMQQIWEREKNA